MPYYFIKLRNLNDIFTAIVGLLDIISGLIVYYSFRFSFTSFLPIIFLTFFYLTLGIWSVYVNLTKGNYLDWRGIVDVINGICLFSIYSGNLFDLLKSLGIIIMIKGGLTLFLITGGKFKQGFVIFL